MNILLISANRETSPAPAIPAGLCAVASSAAEAGHSVSVEDLCFERDSLARVRSAIQAARPDVIGLSLRNIDSSDSTNPTWYLPEAKAIVRICREESQAPVVIGGPAVSLAPASMQDCVGADYAIAGDGEEAFPNLLTSLAQGDKPDPYDLAAGPAHVTDLDSLPLPTFARWLGLRGYTARAASLPVQTKRGCAFECEYCRYPSIEGRNYRLKSPARVADEIEALRAECPGASIEFVDSTFNAPEGHAIQVCDELAVRQNKTPLQSVEINPAFCTEELLRGMERAGFVSVGITPESASDRVLAGLRKGFTSDDVYRAAERLKTTNMLRLWIFMLGGPDETEETARETIDFIEGQLTDRDLVYITYGIRIWPGSGLHRRAVEEGRVSSADNLLRPTFYTSPELSVENLRGMIGRSSFPSHNVMFASDGNHSTLRFAQRLAGVLGVKPPYWRYAAIWNRTAGRLVRRGR